MAGRPRRTSAGAFDIRRREPQRSAFLEKLDYYTVQEVRFCACFDRSRGGRVGGASRLTGRRRDRSPASLGPRPSAGNQEVGMRFRDRASHAAPTLPAAAHRASAAETAVGDLARGRGNARTPVTAAALLAVVALLTAVFGGVQIAAAADGPQSVTFGCTGFPQELTVPPGVTQMNVSVRGASGAGDAGGLGGLSTGVMNVTPGATLRVTVGCQDGYGQARGGNGGRQDVLSANGSNGGGSSGVTDDATGSPLIVA